MNIKKYCHNSNLRAVNKLSDICYYLPFVYKLRPVKGKFEAFREALMQFTTHSVPHTLKVTINSVSIFSASYPSVV